MKEEFKEIRIRAEYVERIEKMIKHSGGFDHVSDYINFVLKELLDPDNESGSEESNEIQDRLRGLGYLS